jgi:proline iminopeptidase
VLSLAAWLAGGCIANPTPHPIEDKLSEDTGNHGGGGPPDASNAASDTAAPPAPDKQACERQGGYWDDSDMACDFAGSIADAVAEDDTGPDAGPLDAADGGDGGDGGGSGDGGGIGDVGPGPDVAPPAVEDRVVTSSGGVELPVRIVGDLTAGDVLVLVHGGPALSADYMRSLEALAGPARAVVTYEQRGAGDATAPLTGDYTIGAHLADLEAVRADLGVASVHLFGHSWGARVAMAYAVAHPEHVTTLLLLGGAPPTSLEASAGSLRFQTRVGELQLQGIVPMILPLDGDAAFQALLPAYFHDPAFAPPAELTATVTSLVAQAATQSQVMALYDVTADLATLTLPVLVLFGDSDPFGLQWQDATVAALSGALVSKVILPACGHFWAECPAAFFEAVNGFLPGPAP